MDVSVSVVRCLDGELDSVFDLLVNNINTAWNNNKHCSILIEKHIDTNEVIVKYLDLGVRIN